MNRKSYTARDKLKMVMFAENKGNRAASRHFTVPEPNIRLWRRTKSSLQSMQRKKRAMRGKPAQYPQVEIKLVDWVKERRQAGLGISYRDIRTEVKHVGRPSSFTVSAGWISNFLKRNNLSVRRRTGIAQKLPPDYEEKLLSFQKYVINLRKEHWYDLRHIGNADQTPLCFDLPYRYTINEKGAKSVTVRTTGHEKSRFTVMLGCTADGGKLPPYLVFKRKTMPKNMVFPSGVHIRVHPKGWMEEKSMKDWISNVWDRRPGALLQPKSMLVLDAFRCHTMPSIKEKLAGGNTNLVIIPGGLTRVLQPLDVSINKPMKDALRIKWNDWLSNGKHSFTTGGNMRAPTLVEIALWIRDAWNDLSPAIIRRAFLKCCISNKLDGSEDDVIWEEDEEDSEMEDDSGTSEEENDSKTSEEEDDSETDEDEEEGEEDSA